MDLRTNNIESVCNDAIREGITVFASSANKRSMIGP